MGVNNCTLVSYMSIIFQITHFTNLPKSIKKVKRSKNIQFKSLYFYIFKYFNGISYKRLDLTLLEY